MFSACQLGYGAVVNQTSIILRPYLEGYRLYVNHRPCPVLPYGGYVRDLAEGERVLRRYRSQLLTFARSAQADA